VFKDEEKSLVVSENGTRLKLAGTKKIAAKQSIRESPQNGMVVWVNSICRVNEYFACSIKKRS
jgi:hypothetical protein